ncbi:MAG: CHAT domain-containing protein [Blastocatellia bacterium]
MPYTNSAFVRFGLACLLCLSGKGLSAQNETAITPAAGQEIERELNGGQTHSYELMLEAGSFVEITVEQLGVNISATLFKPDVKVIFASDSHRGVRGIERVCAIANVAGRYELKVQSVQEKAVPGRYSLKVTELRPATAQDRERIVGQELFAEGDRHRLKNSNEEARRFYQQALKQWEAIGDLPRQAVTLREISAHSGRLMLGQQALDEGEQAVKLYRFLVDRSGEAHSLFTMAEGANWALKDKTRARELYEQALPICHEIGERLIEGFVLRGLAVQLSYSGQKQKAIECIQQSLALLLTTGKRGDVTTSFAELRAICESLDDKSKAIAAFHQARQIFNQAGDRTKEAEALTEIGRLQQKLGETQKALDAYREALALFRAVADRDGEIRTLTAVGELSTLPHEKQQAIDGLTHALSIYTALGDLSGRTGALKSLSRINVSSGQVQKAIEQSYEVRRIWHDAGNVAEEADALQTMAEIHRDVGDNQQAVELCQQAAQLFRSIQDRDGQAKALLLAANTYHLLDDHQQAIDCLNQVVTLSRNLGVSNYEAVAYSLFAAVYQSQRDKEKAADAYLRCITLSREVKDRPLEVGAIHNLGWLHFHHGDDEQAAKYHAEAAGSYRQMGDLVGEANALRGLGRAYGRLGRVEEGVELCQRAIKLAQASREPGWEALAFYGLAQLYFSAERFAEARQNVEVAMQLHESVRANLINWELRAAYQASRYDYYEFYVDVLMRRHNQSKSPEFVAEAFLASERNRARSLLELLTEARADLRLGVPTELLAREASLQQQLNQKLLALRNAERNARQAPQNTNELNGQINVLTIDLRQVRDQIRQANPRLAALTETRPLGLVEIQRELGSDTILLEYSLSDARSYLWAVAKDSIKVFELPDRKTINNQASKVHQLLNDQQPKKAGEAIADWQKRISDSQRQLPSAIAKLSQTVIGPVVPLLGKKRLLIVADGVLQYVPFGALSVSSQPLVVEHEIVNLPSASTIAILRRETNDRQPAPKKLLVLADPVFAESDERLNNNLAIKTVTRSVSAKTPSDLIRSVNETIGLGEDGNIERLPHTKDEAVAIAKSAIGKAPKLAMGFDASREFAISGELNNYRIIHFATHGLLNSKHPDLSGVVLSLVDRKRQSQDGFLRLQDIFRLKLSAELVVLSACQTGLGKEVSGEGLIGLTSGFMYAGSPRVVASLWNVDDKPTAELMTRFYAGMLGPKKLRPAAALRAAQVSMLRDKLWNQPYDWAGFVLQGEWR